MYRLLNIHRVLQWWLPPKQRQRWGHTADDHATATEETNNWTQLFFDLFYVAGCINLGSILKDMAWQASSSNNESTYVIFQSLLYFLGTGLTVMMMWFDKLHFDARFAQPQEDVLHRILDLLQVCAVATALSRIRSPQVLSDTCQHNDMVLLAASLVINALITLYKYAEVARYVMDADLPAAPVAAKRECLRTLGPTLCFAVGAGQAGYMYYFQNASLRDQDNGNGNYNEYGACQGVPANHFPIAVCLAGYFLNLLIGYWSDVWVFDKTRNDQGSKHLQMVEMSVPQNIHLVMHRKREWYMLMFGESIISLLIVDGHNESAAYSWAFYSGILSVVVLAHWHYGAEPHNPDEHALSRSRHSSYLYSALIPIYSLALIAVGASYKLFLYEFSTDASGHRMLEGGGGENYNLYNGGDTYSGQSQQEEEEARQQATANLFCVSMTVVLICMDLRIMLHKGWAKMALEAQQYSQLVLATFGIAKYTVIVALATFSTHHNNPHVMAVSCLVAILLLEGLSILLARYVQQQPSFEADGAASPQGNGHGHEDHEARRWHRTESMDQDRQRAAQERQTLALFERMALLDSGIETVIYDGKNKNTANDKSPATTTSSPPTASDALGGNYKAFV